MVTTEILEVEGLGMHQIRGRTGLRLICQFCSKFIDKGSAALFVWDPEGSVAKVVHKVCNNENGDPYKFTQEVDTGLMYLLWNVGVRGEAMNRAQEKAESLSQF